MLQLGISTANTTFFSRLKEPPACKTSEGPWDSQSSWRSARLMEFASSHLRLAQSQGKQSAHVGDVLQALEQRNQMQQIIIRGVGDPAFDGDGVIY